MALTSESFLESINLLTEHHKKRNRLYSDYVKSLFPHGRVSSIEGVPYLPVRAFKGRRLSSIPESQIYRLMYSSGTGSNGRSEIPIDRETARLQTEALAYEFGRNFGRSRFPLLILSSPPTGSTFSASQAAVAGFSIFSKGSTFALDSLGKPNHDSVAGFLKSSRGVRRFVFGFTYDVWNFVTQIRDSGERLNLQNAFLVHGGGWKRLQSKAVSRDEFTAAVRTYLGIEEVRNYYGMIEQTGSIYVECEKGFLHAPVSGDFLIRHPLTMVPLSPGQTGVIQVFSNLQKSYPGHSLLTEDVGFKHVGQCGCGNPTKRISVTGRLDRAEVRGCSDSGQ